MQLLREQGTLTPAAWLYWKHDKATVLSHATGTITACERGIATSKPLNHSQPNTVAQLVMYHSPKKRNLHFPHPQFPH